MTNTGILTFVNEDEEKNPDDTSKDNDDASKDEDDTQKTTDDTSGASDDPTQSPNSAQNSGSAAKTGDTNSPALWITLLGLSGLALSWNMVIRRKRKNV